MYLVMNTAILNVTSFYSWEYGNYPFTKDSGMKKGGEGVVHKI
jgi:hypothetical protein